MPIEYPGGGVVAEHTAVRERVGIFDVSHLGKASVTGPGAVDFVNACLTNDLRRIGPGKAQYTMCCDASGGVVDDLIAYVRAEDDVFLIPNAANTSEVVRRLAEAAPDGIAVENRHDAYGIVAVQGPRSDEVLAVAGPADRARLHGVRRGRLGWPAGHRVPDGLHRRARVRAGAALGGHAGPLGRADRGHGGARRTAVRAGRPRHAADRDGVPAARPGPVARHHPGAGARGLGGRVEEAAVLGPGGAGRGEGGRSRAAVVGAAGHRPRASRGSTARSPWTAGPSAR